MQNAIIKKNIQPVKKLATKWLNKFQKLLGSVIL
jgi:hypothetical protein